MPERKVRAVVLESSKSDIEVMRREFLARQFGEVLQAASLEEAVQALKNGGPAIAVVGIADGSAPGVRSIEALKQVRPDLPVIATGSAPVPAVILRAAEAGATEFVVRPIQSTEFGQALDRLLRAGGTTGESGRCIAVYSAKGGLGNTTLAVNLAFALARLRSGSHVALVDMVVEGGDVRTFLDINPRYTLEDLAKKSDEVDRPSFKSLLHAYADGVWVCAGPKTPDEGELLTGQRVSSIIRTLAPAFAFTVVDCEHSLTERTLSVLDLADEILLVTQLTVPAVRSLQRTLSLFERLSYPNRKLKVTVNRCGSKSDLTLSDLRKVVSQPIVATISNDYLAMNNANTRGRPLHRVAPKSKATLDLRRLAVDLNGVGVGDGKLRRRRKLFGRKGNPV